MPKTSSSIFTISPTDTTIIQNKIKQSRRRSIVREFSSNTSAHGIPGIARSQSIHNRMFWSISFIFFTTIMTIFVVQTIIDYFEYPTNIDVKITSEWPQSFPAISLCNVSPLRSDRFYEVVLNHIAALNLTNSTNSTTITTLITNYSRILITDKLNRNESIEEFLYPLSSMLYTCIFNGQNCWEADFIPFMSAAYGQCYTFNAKLKNSENNSVRYINENGGNGFLYLGLYVHGYQYFYSTGTGKKTLFLLNCKMNLSFSRHWRYSSCT